MNRAKPTPGPGSTSITRLEIGPVVRTRTAASPETQRNLAPGENSGSYQFGPQHSAPGPKISPLFLARRPKAFLSIAIRLKTREISPRLSPPIVRSRDKVERLARMAAEYESIGAGGLGATQSHRKNWKLRTRGS